MPAVHVAARRLHHASMRMQQWDYSLSGLVGFELHGKTVGVVGTGAIGSALCAILKVRPLLSSSQNYHFHHKRVPVQITS